MLRRGGKLADFEFRETATSLATRIDIHKRFAQHDLNQWMFERIGPGSRKRILDLGCGLGTSCFLFAEKFPGSEITGLDISTELLSEARRQARKQALNIAFIAHSIDNPLPFESEAFNLVTCNFALYYARDLHFSISEIHRVLGKGGCTFLSGPAPSNKLEFFRLQRHLTGKPAPFMPGRMRFEPEALPICRKIFTKVEYHTLTNPLVFHEASPFIDYVQASVTEDSLLWRDLLPDTQAVEHFCNAMRKEVSRIIEHEGNFTMTKVIGGILGYK